MEPEDRTTDDPTGPVPGLEALILRELGRTTYQLARLRLVAAVGLTVVGVAFLAVEPPGWQAGLLFASAAAVGIVGARDLRALRGRSFSVPLYAWVVGSVLAFHTILIVATGGMDSPFLILYVPVAAISGFTLARPRRFLAAVLVPVTLTWGFAAGELGRWWPPLTPGFLGGPVPGGRAVVFVVTDAVVLSLVMLLGGLIGLSFRRAVERAAREAALARQEAVQGARERNRELVALSGAIAHELKNPLASIQGLAGLLAGRFPEGSREAQQTGVLLAEARRMGAVLEEFLNFSRPIHDLALRSIDPGAVASQAAALHEGVAADRGVTLETRVATRTALRADARKVKQVLANLLQNALDASPAGGRVVLVVRPGPGGGVVFLVDDEGPGLAADVRGRLFTPGATTKAAGSGLGLVVARSIAEQHGGALTLEERPEGGVRATLTLPEAPTVAGSAEDDGGERGGGGGPEGEPT